MRSMKLGTITAILGVVVTLLVCWITINATYDIHARGEAPPKRLTSRDIGPFNPLQDLSSQGDDLSISVTSRGRQLSNVRSYYSSLTNSGQAPITPSDIMEPITISVDAPWRILAVANMNYGESRLPVLAWERQSETSFRARPALINPGDSISLRIYLTKDGAETVGPTESPNIRWNTRIINLSNIESDNPNYKQIAEQFTNFGIFVVVWGNGIIFLLFSFILYQTLTILLMFKSGIVSSSKPITVSWLVVGSLLNLAASDAGTTYVYGPVPFISLPIDHLFNATPLALNVVMLLTLAWATRLKKRRHSP